MSLPRLSACVVALLLSAAAAVARVQADPPEPKPETVIPRAQALKMGGGAYIEAYTEKTKNQTTAGYVQASGVYKRWKDADNASRAARLPAAARARIKTIGAALDELNQIGFWHAYRSSGGGTMYSMMAAFEQVERADFVGELTGVMARLPTKRDPAARRRADATLADARKKLAARAKAPSSEFLPLDADARKEYDKEHAEAAEALERIKALLPALPDTAARKVAERAREELTAYDDAG